MIRISCEVTAGCSGGPTTPSQTVFQRAAGTERRLSKGEAVCIAGGRPGSTRLLKPTEDQMLEMELHGMMLVLLDFCLVLV